MRQLLWRLCHHNALRCGTVKLSCIPLIFTTKTFQPNVISCGHFAPWPIIFFVEDGALDVPYATNFL